jgi:hypothetical protein
MTCCRKTYVANTATVDSGALVLSFSEVPIFTNTGRVWFKVCPNIVNTSTAILPITLNMNVGGTLTAVPLYDGWGNVAYSNTIKRGYIYRCGMGSVVTDHVVAYNLNTGE